MSQKVKRVRGTTRVSRKNQITLPVAALKAARVSQGDELRVQANGDGRILLERSSDPLEEFVGAVAGLSAAPHLYELRGESGRWWLTRGCVLSDASQRRRAYP